MVMALSTPPSDAKSNKKPLETCSQESVAIVNHLRFTFLTNALSNEW